MLRKLWFRMKGKFTDGAMLNYKHTVVMLRSAQQPKHLN